MAELHTPDTTSSTLPKGGRAAEQKTPKGPSSKPAFKVLNKLTKKIARRVTRTGSLFYSFGIMIAAMTIMGTVVVGWRNAEATFDFIFKSTLCIIALAIIYSLKNKNRPPKDPDDTAGNQRSSTSNVVYSYSVKPDPDSLQFVNYRTDFFEKLLIKAKLILAYIWMVNVLTLFYSTNLIRRFRSHRHIKNLLTKNNSFELSSRKHILGYLVLVRCWIEFNEILLVNNKTRVLRFNRDNQGNSHLDFGDGVLEERILNAKDLEKFKQIKDFKQENDNGELTSLTSETLN